MFSVIRVSFIDVINYSTARVRPTLSDITAIRSPVLATFLANRHDNTKQMENEKHWRLQETVNLPPQVYGVRIPDSPPSFRSVRIEVITADCLSAYRGSIPLQTARYIPQ